MDNPESFGATELKWLEHTFINLAKKSGFTKLVNAPTPFEGVIESALLNDFKSTVADARLMMATMRYPVLEPALPTVPKQTTTPGEELEQGTEPKRGATSQELFIHLGGISKPAVMVKSADHWVIKAGSPIKQRENVSDQQAASLREIYADKIESGVTTKDLVFSSPSAAARFVVGRSSNGRAAWKNAKGTLLGALQDQGRLS